jgi:phage-related protein
MDALFAPLTDEACRAEQAIHRVGALGARLAFSWTRTKFPEAVYVLHAFQKKTQKTARGDLVLAKDRYQEVLMRRKSL